MLAVHAPLADVEARPGRREARPRRSPTATSPAQCVLSGATAEIARAEGAFAEPPAPLDPAAGRGRVPQPARGRRERAVPGRCWRRCGSGRTRSRSSPTRRPAVPGRPHDARDLLADQLARPVAFVGQVGNMARAGVRTFVEVGPGSVLTRLAEATLSPGRTWPDWDCVRPRRVRRKERPGVLDLAHALARLAARGHPVDLAAWEAGQTYPVPDRQARAHRADHRGELRPPQGGEADCRRPTVSPRPSPGLPSIRSPRPTSSARTRTGHGGPGLRKGTSMTDTPTNPPADPSALPALGDDSAEPARLPADAGADGHAAQAVPRQPAGRPGARFRPSSSNSKPLLTGQPVPAVAFPPAPTPAPAPVPAHAPRTAADRSASGGRRRPSGRLRCRLRLRWRSPRRHRPPLRRRPPRAARAASSSRWWRRRRATRRRCSSWTWPWTPTWASTRSSGSRSSRPCRSSCPTPRPSSPSTSAPCTPSATSPTSSPGRPHAPSWPARSRESVPARSRPSVPTRSRSEPATCRRGRHPPGGGGGEDGLPGGDAGAGHGPGRRPGHRLDQAGRDPLGPAGAAARRPAGQARAPRHAPHPPGHRGVPRQCGAADDGRPTGHAPAGGSPPFRPGAHSRLR